MESEVKKEGHANNRKHQENGEYSAKPSESTMSPPLPVNIGPRPLRFIRKAAKGEHVGVFRTYIFDLVKDHRASLLLCQLDFWFQVQANAGEDSMYKSVNPGPGHWSNKGGTWWDELRLTRKTYARVFAKLGVAYKSEKDYLKAVANGTVFIGKDGKEKPFCSYFVPLPKNVIIYYRNQAWFDRNFADSFLVVQPPIPAEKAIKARVVRCYQQLVDYKLAEPFKFRDVETEVAIQYFMAILEDSPPDPSRANHPAIAKAINSAWELFEELNQRKRDLAQIEEDEVATDDPYEPTSREANDYQEPKVAHRVYQEPELPQDRDTWSPEWINRHQEVTEDLLQDSDQFSGRGANMKARRMAERMVRQEYAEHVEKANQTAS